jgi:hypothetical protein
MLPYKYSKLNVELQEIRLLTLLPSEFGDAIRFTLWHISLLVPDQHLLQRMPLEELRETLPPSWEVYETLERRFLFNHVASEYCTQWTHPDPNFDRARYDPPLEDLYPSFQIIYEALSYTWGSTENPETAYVETSPSPSPLGGNTCLTLKVSQNLALALRHLRYPDEPRTLWVDAVCINQGDITERSEQVGRMASIYRLAHRIVVWLGPEANNSGLALSTLLYHGEQMEALRGNSRLLSPQCAEPKWYLPECKLPYTEEIWQALHDLGKRPWFERLWIWQEIQLANHRAIVQCGYDKISWYHFRCAMMSLYETKGVPSFLLREQLKFLRPLVRDRQGYPLSLLFNAVRERKCSEPRDRVYGLLGIAPPGFASKIRPQYSSSIGDVYRDACLVHLDLVRRLDLLHGCELDERQIEAPSWVPDLTVSKKSRSFSAWQLSSGMSCTQARHLPQDILEVTGIQCATVRIVSQTAPENIREILSVIQEWEPEDLTSGLYVTGESLLDAYVSTLCLNWVKELLPGNAYPSLQEWKEIFFNKIFVSAAPVDADVVSDRWVYRVLNWVRGRTFIAMDEGYIGLGSKAVQPGKC